MKFASESSFWSPQFAAPSAWHEHAPFAFWLTKLHRPRLFVELGTYCGFSYFCFCEAIERLGLQARTFAIDTWKGDDHGGFYGEEVFQALGEHHRRYAGFSRLVRSSFDEALPHFADGSIDLLHIDGRHFYEDVQHEFTSWAAKLSERAIVLFHDTNVREAGFGVFRFWQEIAARYPSFEFFHGHGLGMMGLGRNLSPELRSFFDTMADPQAATEVRGIYSRLGAAVAREIELVEAGRRLGALEGTAAQTARREAALNASVSGLTVQLGDVTAQLGEASARIAVLERTAAEGAKFTDGLLARLDDRARLLAEALGKIAALEASVAEAQGRSASLATTLEERTARLAEAESRIAAYEALVQNARLRAGELDAALDRSAAELKAAEASLADRDRATAELSEARERLAAVEASLVARDRELAHHMQRIATIKTSLSWRLMAPFRELYRPIRRLQNSRLGINFVAAWRHPRNSRKRKADRSRQMALLKRDPTPPSRLPVKWRALLRHPFSSRSRKLYRAQEQVWQPDIAVAQNLPPARPEGRQDAAAPLRQLREPHPAGFRGEILAALRPFDDIIAEWSRQPRTPQQLSRDSLYAALYPAISPGTLCVLSLSQDDYRASVGGIQLCVILEEEAFKRAEAAYIHLSPLRPLPALAPATSPSDYMFALSLNGEHLGHVVASDLINALATQRGRGVHHRLVVHSLLGHSPEIVTALSEAVGLRRGIYWLHDYFALCPSYNLMRNAVTYCGAPPPTSPACQICYVGAHRATHLSRMRKLFSEIAFTLVAPSASALSVWQQSSDFPVRATVVQEHCKLHKDAYPTPPKIIPTGAPLRVAFLGFPTLHKGWPIFHDVVALCASDQRYAFYHLGRHKSSEASKAIRYHYTNASTNDLHAMSKAIASNRIDAVLLPSLCRETYNFTSLEALAGGALIVTLAGSGNIAAVVNQHECGLVLPDETALKHAFVTGSLLEQIRKLQYTRFTIYTYSFNSMSADVPLE
jgi:glycosyltransferase involved in cell wall biosynthesis